MGRCARRSCGRWHWRALTRAGRAGVDFDNKWYCSTTCLQADVQQAIAEAGHFDEWVTPMAVPVGRLLVLRRAASKDSVEAALNAQRTSGRRLGAELVAMRATSKEHVLRALAAQAGVGCMTSIDAERVASGPGALSRDTVKMLRTVPFDFSATQHRLAVACGSPLPVFALAAVREMTGYQILPFLVEDELLEELIDGYGRSCPDALPASDRPRDLREAAATIAEAARRGLARHMQRVKCDAFTWVRLEGDTYKKDLMLTHTPAGESTWQAAPTSL